MGKLSLRLSGCMSMLLLSQFVPSSPCRKLLFRYRGLTRLLKGWDGVEGGEEVQERIY